MHLYFSAFSNLIGFFLGFLKNLFFFCGSVLFHLVGIFFNLPDGIDGFSDHKAYHLTSFYNVNSILHKKLEQYNIIIDLTIWFLDNLHKMSFFVTEKRKWDKKSSRFLCGCWVLEKILISYQHHRNQTDCYKDLHRSHLFEAALHAFLFRRYRRLSSQKSYRHCEW